jgi:hypothetical protein
MAMVNSATAANCKNTSKKNESEKTNLAEMHKDEPSGFKLSVTKQASEKQDEQKCFSCHFGFSIMNLMTPLMQAPGVIPQHMHV